MSDRKGDRCATPIIDGRKRATFCNEPATTERAIEGVTLPFCANHASEIDREGKVIMHNLGGMGESWIHEINRDKAALADAAPKRPPPAIDLDNLRKALLGTRVAFDDLDFVVEDLLRPLHRRTWGYVTHAEKHEEARRALTQGLTYALRMLGIEPPDDDGGEHGDPSGNGDAGPH